LVEAVQFGFAVGGRELSAKMAGMCSDKKDVVLFDLDGVLVDSRAAITGCINHALDAHGLPKRTPVSLHRFIGPPLTAAFAELTDQAADSALVLSCLESYRARYAIASLRDTTVVPGIPDTLVKLASSCRLAVATSKPLAFADPLLTTLCLRDFFELVGAPALNAHSEDKTATIRGALSALNADRAVMVGDRSFDIIGAHACAIPAIGVSWGIGSAEELETYGAEIVIDVPSRLPGAVSDLLVK
jgi:phosphoglycolate phosphatase